MDREIYKSKVGNPAELLQRILDAAARIKKREDQLRKKKHVIFTYELQSALKLTVGF